MGGFIAKALSALFNTKKDMRILILGLDASGKTTILYKFKLTDTITTIPTIGFNVETVEYKNIKFTVWDIGGQDKIRKLWKHYYMGTDGIIFVVDSNDKERMSDYDDDGYNKSARDELHALLVEDELKNVPVLVLANKQDLPNALSLNEITSQLALNKISNHKWYIQSCCGLNGDGLYEGLDWLSNTLSKKKRNK
mmetsp:Transcript_103301/g.126237  ORF Transcript_103301/g.126237 Transcript_103301/m.126237 type:complete len:195 (+) Transcript_103301:106-690(+)